MNALCSRCGDPMEQEDLDAVVMDPLAGTSLCVRCREETDRMAEEAKEER